MGQAVTAADLSSCRPRHLSGAELHSLVLVWSSHLIVEFRGLRPGDALFALHDHHALQARRSCCWGGSGRQVISKKMSEDRLRAAALPGNMLRLICPFKNAFSAHAGARARVADHTLAGGGADRWQGVFGTAPVSLRPGMVTWHGVCLLAACAVRAFAWQRQCR